MNQLIVMRLLRGIFDPFIPGAKVKRHIDDDKLLILLFCLNSLKILHKSYIASSKSTLTNPNKYDIRGGQDEGAFLKGGCGLACSG